MKKLILLFLSFVALRQAANAQVEVDLAVSYQTVESFAASDCWVGNYVGKLWNDATKNSIAKWLFSQEQKSDGSPEGIGLSMWRVNLGAGTAEQGDNSNISDVARRAECFLNPNGSGYDWTKQAGQQWFFRKAKEYGCDNFVLFSNSPPVQLTRNAKGYANGDGNTNLRSDKYNDFADFMTTVIEHFDSEGIHFSYISPVNEPQYDWEGHDQEGSPWHNSEIKQLVTSLDASLASKNLSSKILITEAGSWNSLAGGSGRADNQMYAFFNPASASYIGNLPTLEPLIGGHSYWTHNNDGQISSARTAVKNAAASYGLRVFQTEWSLLGEGYYDGNLNYDNATYMDLALFMAKIIHSDMAITNVSSWSYWTSMGQEQWGHKDRFLLISLLPGGNAYNPVTTPGTAEDRPTLWALGNYSYFIRPGYRRIGLTGAADLSGLMGTAYLAPDSSQIVVVYVNMTHEAKQITTTFQNMPARLAPVKNRNYVTAQNLNLRKMPNGLPFDGYEADRALAVPARSVTTAVYELAATPDDVTKVPTEQTSTLHIYPTCVGKAGRITVKLPEWGNKPLRFQIYANNGLLMHELVKTPVAAETTIDIPNTLQAGIYFLQVQSDNGTHSGKFIVY